MKRDLRSLGKSVEIVLTDWVKQNQIENKVTEFTNGTDNIVIKGYVIFDTKGMSKKEIARTLPYIEGVNVFTETGDTVFIKHKTE